MKRKTVSIVLVLISWVFVVNAQTFTLSEFESDRDQLVHKLEISDSKAHKLERSYELLDKQLVKLNDEIKGKSKSQVKGLIEKKYKKAGDSMSSFLSPSEYKQIQSLNSKQMSTLTNHLTGKNGVFGKNGENKTAIVVGTCIVMGTAKR
jgi:C-terminal processing protease CtpA/Prc